MWMWNKKQVLPPKENKTQLGESMDNNTKFSISFGVRKHSGGLKESILTTKYISENDFNSIINKYDYYGFDERVNQIMFISKDMRENYTWAFIQIGDNDGQ